jgi:hypothetical protein
MSENVVRGIAAPWIPEPGVAVVGESGAGLSAS